MQAQLDWDSITPEHPVCESIVEVPTVRIQRRRQEYHHGSKGVEGQNEIVVQWFGESGDGTLGKCNLQFTFPLMSEPDSVKWFGHPEWYRTVMLGKMSGWPNPSALEQFLNKGLSRESIILYVITSNIGIDNGRGETVPSAFIVPVCQLGDSTFGAIRPREFANWSIPKEEVAKLQRGR